MNPSVYGQLVTSISGHHITPLTELVRFFPDDTEFKVKEEKWQKEMDEANKLAKQKENETLIANLKKVSVKLYPHIQIQKSLR